MPLLPVRRMFSLLLQAFSKAVKPRLAENYETKSMQKVNLNLNFLKNVHTWYWFRGWL